MKSDLKLIKSALEYRSIKELTKVPNWLRGIYALYKKSGKHYNLVYIGMSAGGEGRIKSRLNKHKRNKDKSWDYFSYYEVWDNVSDEEIEELEGLFRQLYRFDHRANAFNKQQTHKPLVSVRRNTESQLNLTKINKKNLHVK